MSTPAHRASDDQPDARCVLAAREGDVEAFAVLARWWAPRLLSFCRSQVRGEDEDIVQDVLLAAWSRLPDLDDPHRFRAWLYAIARNRCREVLRTRGRRATDPSGPEAFTDRPDEGLGPESTHLGGEAMEALRSVLAAMPGELSRVWWFAETDQMSYAEIARVESVPVSTVRGRLARARTSVAAGMEEWR